MKYFENLISGLLDPKKWAKAAKKAGMQYGSYSKAS